MSTGYFEAFFETIKYPAGEQHIRYKGNGIFKTVIADKVRDFNGLMNVLVADDIAKRNGYEVKWVIPYFPFARDDRRNDYNDGQELRFALNAVKHLDITVIDPHSDVTAVLPHYTQAMVVNQFRDYGLFDNVPFIAIPDAGAAKKAYTWIDSVDFEDVIQCLKHRDPRTGRLDGFEVVFNGGLEGHDVVIVDDMCDAGGTFLGLAQELKDKGAGKLTLAVTHGLFTKGLDTLREVFDEIWTLDIYNRSMQESVHQVSTQSLIEWNIPL